MTMEGKRVRLEVWPVGADELGVWLLSGTDALRGVNLAADDVVHAEVALMLNGAIDTRCTAPAAVHSTSWREDGPHILLTYIAVIECEGPVLAYWPGALPIAPELLPTVGNPLPHGPTECPQPRRVDVLHHALRHLAFLRTYDVGAAAALRDHWVRHLDVMTPALAGMYAEVA